MKRLFLVGASIILLGAGCASTSNTTQPTAVNNSQETNKTQQPVQTVEKTPETQSPAQTNNTPAPVTSTEVTYTMAAVEAANSPTKCWTVVNGNVYDVTNYAPKHPGGREAVLKLCGTDGTAAFTKTHDGQENPEAELKKTYIGKLAK